MYSCCSYGPQHGALSVASGRSAPRESPAIRSVLIMGNKWSINAAQGIETGHLVSVSGHRRAERERKRPTFLLAA